MTDPLLHAWLLEIATQPPEVWYGHGRLALADWLEERGDRRADVVRDQAAYDALKRDRDDQILRRLAAGSLTRGEKRILSLAFNVPIPVRLDDAAGDRERQRLLALFPDVTLTGPCPCHEPLPYGASVQVAFTDTKRRAFRFVAGYCMTCAGSKQREASAPWWLIRDWRLIREWNHLAADHCQMLAPASGPASVYAVAGSVKFRLPLDPANPGHPLIVLPATSLVGEPLPV